MKKIFLIFTLLFICGLSSYAVDVYYTPIAHSLDGASVKAYFGDSNENIIKAAVGIGGLELGITNYNVKEFDTSKFIKNDTNSTNLEWQMLPETFVTPAIAIGAKDIMGHLSDNATFFAVLTKDFKAIDLSGTFSKIQVSAGYGTESLNGLFSSLNLEIKNRVYLSGEAYSGSFNWGGGVNINDFVSVGYMNFDDKSYGELKLQFEF